MANTPTPMQQTVLDKLNDNKSVALIAAELNMTPGNVYGHIRRMTEKRIRVPKPARNSVAPIAAGIKQPVNAVDVHESVGDVIAQAIEKVEARLVELEEHEAKVKADHANVLKGITQERSVLAEHLKQYRFADGKLAGTEVKGLSDKAAARPSADKGKAPVSPAVDPITTVS
jgi:hypothetical protein